MAEGAAGCNERRRSLCVGLAQYFTIFLPMRAKKNILQPKLLHKIHFSHNNKFTKCLGDDLQ